MPYLSKCIIDNPYDIHFEEYLDDIIQYDNKNFTKLYAVPRPGNCVSSVYLRIINIFCN